MHRLWQHDERIRLASPVEQWPRDAVLARHLLAQSQEKLRSRDAGRRTAVRQGRAGAGLGLGRGCGRGWCVAGGGFKARQGRRDKQVGVEASARNAADPSPACLPPRRSVPTGRRGDAGPRSTAGGEGALCGVDAGPPSQEPGGAWRRGAVCI